MSVDMNRLLFVIAAVLVLSASLGTAVFALRSRVRRRWLWSLVSVLGLPVATLNWTTGEISTRVLAVQLLGIGVRSREASAEWLLSVAFPLGAAVFLSVRQRLMAKARTSLGTGSPPE